MNCRDFQDLLPLCVTGSPGGAEFERLYAHLESGCEECRRELEELRSVAAAIPHGLDAATPSPEALQRLMARVRGAEAGEPVVKRDEGVMQGPEAGRLRLVLPVAGTALAASLVGMIAGHFLWAGRFEQEQQVRLSLEERLGTLEEQLRSTSDLTTALAGAAKAAESVTAFLTSAAWAMIPMQSAESDAWGRLLWNNKDQELCVITPNLKPAEEGYGYRLWVQADELSEPVQVSSFGEIESAGGIFRMRLPEGITSIASAVISYDPISEDVSSPVTEVLSGRFQQ